MVQSQMKTIFEELIDAAVKLDVDPYGLTISFRNQNLRGGFIGCRMPHSSLKHLQEEALINTDNLSAKLLNTISSTNVSFE